MRFSGDDFYEARHWSYLAFVTSEIVRSENPIVIFKISHVSAIECFYHGTILLLNLTDYMTLVDEHTSEIQQLCAQHKVKKLYVFGSALTRQFKSDSDIDLIVDFESQDIAQYADNYFDLKFALEKVFKRRVDLLEEKTIKNPYFLQVIKNQRQLLYGA
jgi:predicted nucleotidyltransferase